MIINSNDDIDNLLLEKFDISDLNYKDIILYRDLLIEATGEESYSNMSIEDFLIRLGVLRKDRNSPNNEYKLTVGGLLFFGKYNSILDYYPKFQLDYFKKSSVFSTDWSDRISAGDKDYPELNVFSFYMKTMEKLLLTIDNKFNLTKNLTRDSFYMDMSKVLREALTNSLTHAYYGYTPIKITSYDDYWEFENPGNMRISKEEFVHGGKSIVRNSVISILFRKVGLVERAGSGGPRIFDTTSKYNLKIPDIVTSDTDTIIRIWRIESIMYYQERSKVEKIILKYILSNRFITKSIALEELNLSEYAFRNALKTLIKDNIIIQIGNGRNTKYSLFLTDETKHYFNKRMLVELNDLLKP